MELTQEDEFCQKSSNCGVHNLRNLHFDGNGVDFWNWLLICDDFGASKIHDVTYTIEKRFKNQFEPLKGPKIAEKTKDHQFCI